MFLIREIDIYYYNEMKASMKTYIINEKFSKNLVNTYI
jgi:hypothetical protein